MEDLGKQCTRNQSPDHDASKSKGPVFLSHNKLLCDRSSACSKSPVSKYKTVYNAPWLECMLIRTTVKAWLADTSVDVITENDFTLKTVERMACFLETEDYDPYDKLAVKAEISNCDSADDALKVHALVHKIACKYSIAGLKTKALTNFKKALPYSGSDLNEELMVSLLETIWSQPKFRSEVTRKAVDNIPQFYMQYLVQGEYIAGFKDKETLALCSVAITTRLQRDLNVMRRSDWSHKEAQEEWKKEKEELEKKNEELKTAVTQSKKESEDAFKSQKTSFEITLEEHGKKIAEQEQVVTRSGDDKKNAEIFLESALTELNKREEKIREQDTTITSLEEKVKALELQIDTAADNKEEAIIEALEVDNELVPAEEAELVSAEEAELVSAEEVEDETSDTSETDTDTSSSPLLLKW